MNRYAILLPCSAMVLVTALVWLRLYVERLSEMRARSIDPQSLSTVRAGTLVLEHVQGADNFRNLFEVPVLFYVLCLALALTQMTTPFLMGGAWAFVALRAAHSFIHVTYNRVLHRFIVYATSTVLLFVRWGVFAMSLAAS
jgi:hypothetical protein